MAAARVDTPIFMKMLLTCRSIVFPLRNSWRGDGPVGLPGSDETEDFQLAGREAVGTLRPRARERVDASDFGSGPQPLEGLPRRRELERRAVAIPKGPAREGQQDANARCEVRDAGLLPHRERATQGLESSRRGTVGKQDRASALGRHGRQDLGIEMGGDRVELAGGAAGLLDVARRQQDLDRRGEQPRPLERVARGFEPAPDAARGLVSARLCQAKERQSGLGLTPGPARLFIRLLGLAQLAAQAEDLGLLVEGVPRRLGGLGRAGADGPRLGARLRSPRARRRRAA